MKNIIAYSGAHGTGKTTAVYELASKLKKEVAGEVGILLETARRCPFPILSNKTTSTTREAQMWIFSEQMRQELEMADRYDVVVSDRTIVDCIGYTSIMGWHDMVFAQVTMAKLHAEIYDRVYFRGAADNPYCTDDNVRSTDLDIRNEYECRLLEIYREVGINVIREEMEGVG